MNRVIIGSYVRNRKHDGHEIDENYENKDG